MPRNVYDVTNSWLRIISYRLGYCVSLTLFLTFHKELESLWHMRHDLVDEQSDTGPY